MTDAHVERGVVPTRHRKRSVFAGEQEWKIKKKATLAIDAVLYMEEQQQRQ